MLVNQISIGRFYHFHLARQMQRFNLLDKIYTGYPKFKLKNEQGIPQEKIITFPWVQTPYMARGRFGLDKLSKLSADWEYFAMLSLDNYASKKLNKPGILIALSGFGLKAGLKTKSLGGKYITDRASSHMRFQNDILKEEYNKWDVEFKGIDNRKIIREEMEYENADFISVPSTFVYNSFIEKGIEKEKLKLIPFGANLSHFNKISDPDNQKFRILWVGQVSFRKGFLYALEAFDKLAIKNKVFTVIGTVEDSLKPLIGRYNLQKVDFLGNIKNSELIHYFNSHHVFVLSSIEEGFGMVQGEALACGCPVIATHNTGAEDLFTNGKEGFIIPIRDSKQILNAFHQFLDDKTLREKMGESGVSKMRNLGGWDHYGNMFHKLINEIK